MRWAVGFFALSLTGLAFSCGKSESNDSGRDPGSGGKPAAGASAAGSGGSRASGGSGQLAGAGGLTAGTSAQSGAAGSANAGALAGSGAHAGSSGSSSGAGGTEPSGGEAGGGTTGEAGATGSATGHLTMFVMFDRSWSMNLCGDGTDSVIENNTIECPTTLSRWQLTSTAMTQFFQDPAAAGLVVALRFFPDDRPAAGCDGYPDPGAGGFPLDASAPAQLNCDVGACSQPLVDAAALTAQSAPTDLQETKLVDAVASSTPPGPEAPNPEPATPTSPALAGAEQWAVAFRQAHPDEPVAVVLITDGEAQGCDTNIANIAKLASDAKDTADVRTYVVGLTGSSESALSQIATAGGTEAFFVSDGGTVVADLFAALSAIRSGR